MKTKPSDLSPLTERLTNTPGEKHPRVCQACGGSNMPTYGNGLLRLSLDRWQEHDHNDRPENLILVLCDVCSKRIIKPHARLYERLQANAPWPGCMQICIDCDFRDGIRCTHEAAKSNGGAGVMLTIGKPTHAMVDGRDYRGPMTLWPSAATDCKQKRLNPAKR